MTISIDIAGFYYSIDLDFDPNFKTVFDVMRAASGRPGENGGVMTFDLDRDQKFISEISVRYSQDATPTTRQENGSLPKKRPLGVYRFVDDVTDPQNRVNGTGGIPGLLAWQYYVFDSENRLKSKFGADGTRAVLPATTSNKGLGAVELADNDRIVWRVIAIFGINQFFDANRELLLSNAAGGPMGVKTAAAMLENAKDTNLM